MAMRVWPAPAQVDELLRRCSGGSGGSKDRGRAAWNLCLLLFSAKTATSPMYSSLANQFDGKVAFGEVRRAEPCPAVDRFSSMCSPARPGRRLSIVKGRIMLGHRPCPAASTSQPRTGSDRMPAAVANSSGQQPLGSSLSNARRVLMSHWKRSQRLVINQ